MKISLDLKEDTDLRKYIKDMIKGQIKSIMRDEFKEIIESLMKETLTPKFKAIGREQAFKEFSTTFFRNYFEKGYDFGSGYTSTKRYNRLIEKLTKEILQDRIKESFK